MIDFEQDELSIQSPVARIKVMGVGGAGGNTVNHMISSKYENVEFIVVNTDVQALRNSQASVKLQIGSKSTRGLGAGANPEIGKKAAEEDLEKICNFLKESDIVFLTAGLGGGTGSGALPVIAKAAKEVGVLCVAVVTKPFLFEGKKRMKTAESALENLKNSIDTLIVIPNQKLLDIADHKVSLIDAFGMINEVTHQFVKSVADIILKPGHINVDFADICTIMRDMGLAVMGTGVASGPDRAQKAALQAISSPLLENADIHDAKAVLLNITGSSKLGLHEVHSAASIIYQTAQDAEIIMGSVIDESMGDDVLVTIIATGIGNDARSSVNRNVVKFSEDIIPTPQIQTSSKSLEENIEVEESKKQEVQPAELDPLNEINPNDIEVPTFLRNMKKESLNTKIKPGDFDVDKISDEDTNDKF